MRANCPYCGSKMTGEALLPPMSSRKLRIYRAVVAAGYKGILSTDLTARMYGDDEWPTPGGCIVLRVQICEINKKIASLNQRIVGKRSIGYRLVSTKGKDHGKTAEETTKQANPGAS